MDERTLTRKRRLQELIAGKPFFGNQSAFAEKAGLTKGRITQLLDPNDSFGERSARNMAAALRLPADYFDGNQTPLPHGVPSAQDELDAALLVLTKVLQSADKSILIAVKPLLAAMADDPETAKNKSNLILKLLVADRDKSHKSPQDGARQPRIFENMGVLDLGDGNGRSNTNRATEGGRKK